MSFQQDHSVLPDGGSQSTGSLQAAVAVKQYNMIVMSICTLKLLYELRSVGDV